MRKQSRRVFLKGIGVGVGAVVAGPAIVRAQALGLGGSVSASERIGMGIIGYGGRGTDVMGHFLNEKDVQWRAVCDTRKQRQAAGKTVVDKKYGNADCTMYTDLREMVGRKDIDAVLIATGCHWHALATILAAKEGKDVYCEKPMSLTVAEGRAVVETCKRYGTIYQAGHQRRSVDSFRFMAEVVRKGMIGQLKTALCTVWENPALRPEGPRAVPEGFDYEMWLGCRPWHPYTEARVRGWAYFWDTGGGMMLDMGVHWTDMVQFVRQMDDMGPVEYEGEGVFDPTAFSDVPVTGEYRAKYADGATLIMRESGPFEDRHIRFEGTEGWISLMDSTNAVTASPSSILKMRSISAKGWGDAGDHVRNFLDGVKTRNPMTTCYPESAHRATAIGHLGNIALRLGRKVKFEPKTEMVVGDDEAARMLSRAMRGPWHL